MNFFPSTEMGSKRCERIKLVSLMQVTLNISQDKPVIEIIPVPLLLLLLLFCSFDFTELLNSRWYENNCHKLMLLA